MPPTPCPGYGCAKEILVIIGNFRLSQAKAFDFVQGDQGHGEEDGVTV